MRGKTALRGSLAGGVSLSGTPFLTESGRPVTILKSGRYTVVVNDRSTKSGLVLDPAHGHGLTLTSAGFVGKKQITITLTKGQWSFGAKHAFLVTS